MKLVLAAVALALSAPAMAVNVVTNGSFETGDFTGFEQFGDTGFTGVVQGVFIEAPTDGEFQAVFGPVSGVGGIRQTLSNAAGELTLSFDLANNSGAGNYVTLDGVTLLSNIADSGFQTYSFTVNVGANAVLEFGFSNPPSYYSLDNIVATGSVVPEPATWAMLIVGFGLVGTAMRRRNAALAA